MSACFSDRDREVISSILLLTPNPYSILSKRHLLQLTSSSLPLFIVCEGLKNAVLTFLAVEQTILAGIDLLQKTWKEIATSSQVK